MPQTEPPPDTQGPCDPGGHSPGTLTKGICGPQGSGYNAPQDVNWSSVLLRKKGAVLEGKEDDSGSILYFHVHYSHSAETTAKAVCAKAAVE